MESDSVPYYDEEDVIGSSGKYHRTSCHVIRNIYQRNLKRLRSWEKAVAIGLEPCGVCNPFYRRTATESPPSSGPTVSASQLADWRRSLLRIFDVLDHDSERPDRRGLQIGFPGYNERERYLAKLSL